MTGRKVSFYWRFCWIFLTPVTMIIVFVYSTATLEPLTYAGLNYPDEFMIAGWSIFFIGLIQVPLWGSYAFYHYYNTSIWSAFVETFKPSKRWGPYKDQNRIEWLKFKEEARERHRLADQASTDPFWKKRLLQLLFGKY